MITFTRGNLLEAEAEAVVNTVNTVGIMGKGIALMFRRQFPDNFKAYARACKAGEVRIGNMFVTEQKDMFDPRRIINFPTKTHWRVKTRIEWVQDGLKDLIRVIDERGIRSIAIPPLGCGNGGLAWGTVRPLIESALNTRPGLNAIIYEPTRKYSYPNSSKTGQPTTARWRPAVPATVQSAKQLRLSRTPTTAPPGSRLVIPKPNTASASPTPSVAQPAPAASPATTGRT